VALNFGPFEGTVSEFRGNGENQERYAIIFGVLVKIKTGYSDYEAIFVTSGWV
jgi:hypothetical protein